MSIPRGILRAVPLVLVESEQCSGNRVHCGLSSPGSKDNPLWINHVCSVLITNASRRRYICLSSLLSFSSPLLFYFLFQSLPRGSPSVQSVSPDSHQVWLLVGIWSWWTPWRLSRPPVWTTSCFSSLSGSLEVFLSLWNRDIESK